MQDDRNVSIRYARLRVFRQIDSLQAIGRAAILHAAQSDMPLSPRGLETQTIDVDRRLEIDIALAQGRRCRRSAHGVGCATADIQRQRAKGRRDRALPHTATIPKTLICKQLISVMKTLFDDQSRCAEVRRCAIWY